MEQDLTASALFNVQAKITEMFSEGGVPSIDLDPNLNQAKTAAALMERQAARTTPITDPTGTCRGVTIYHLDGEFTSAAAVTTGFASEDCDLDVANDPESVGTEYDHNLWAEEGFQINDGDCDNLFTNPAAAVASTDRIADIIAPRLSSALKLLRRKLNTRAIAFLAAQSSTVNRDLNLPTYITHAGTQFNVNRSGFFQDPTSLTDLSAIINNNDMPDNSFLISGRQNYYNAVIDSRYFRLDDDKRNVSRWSVDQLAGGNLYFDINKMDAALTGANTFAVMPQSYAMWNVQLFGSAPRLVDASKNLYVYSMADPSLSIVENGVLRPVQYNILYQYVCTGTNTLGQPVFTHKWLIRYLGGIAPSPAATDGATGILRFVDAFAPGI